MGLLGGGGGQVGQELCHRRVVGMACSGYLTLLSLPHVSDEGDSACVSRLL